MKRIAILFFALVGMMIFDVNSAQAWPGWRRRARVTYYVPAQTATVAEVQAATGNRTYSYEPTTTYYRSYSSSRSSNRVSTGGFNDAGFKMRAY
jgi:hypothetical protein